MPEQNRFLNFPASLPPDVLPKIVLFGVPLGSSYPDEDTSGYVLAPNAIRAASKADAQFADRWDFDLGGPLFDDAELRYIDIGDLQTTATDNAGNRRLIEATTRNVLSQGATPLMLGGDDSVPIPFLAGFAEYGPIWILQIDAHIDWREERFGERFGFSSTMRRASEMPHGAWDHSSGNKRRR